MSGWRCACLVAAAVLGACKPSAETPRHADFAVLARSAAQFEQARPGRQLQFPADHGAHPDYRIEWWYLTASLEDPEGRPYGAQWTLFRTAARAQDMGLNAWQDPQVYMAHVAITTPDGHLAFQRYARGGEHGGLAQAGVAAMPFAAWLDDWSLASTGAGWLPLEVAAEQGASGFRLSLDSARPLVLQGAGGFSQKHPAGGGSYYYSHPWLEATGELRVDGQRVAVRGPAWLDHEWSSQFLQPDQAGWDWLALHLDSGDRLMIFRLRPVDSARASQAFLHGVLLAPDGTRTVLDPGRIGLRAAGWETVQGRELPLAWRIELPQVGRALDVRALHPRQWMDVDFAYWEGVVIATGQGPENTGRGYLELTGYPASE